MEEKMVDIFHQSIEITVWLRVLEERLYSPPLGIASNDVSRWSVYLIRCKLLDRTLFVLARSVPMAVLLLAAVRLVVSDEFVGDDDKVYKIDTDDGGLELHCAARLDGENKHPLDDRRDDEAETL